LNKMKKDTGWARHSTFGMRQEWLELYLTNRQGWASQRKLGNKQVDSLVVWLKTIGLVNKQGELTRLGKLFRSAGTNSLDLWQLLWVNVVFNLPTARWYVHHMGLGEWTTSQLRSFLEANVPHLAKRTVTNAILELVSLLERTPVGRELEQGAVSTDRPRVVARRGTIPCNAAIIHALGRLYLKEDKAFHAWDDDLIWPWTVFGCPRPVILQRLMDICQNCYEVNETGLTIRNLNREWWECGNIATTLR